MTEEIKKSINSYLSFKLGEEEFAAHVSQVLNILEMTKITKVPKSPVYMKGVINLRGMVLPVVDTRIKFGMPETIPTEKTCIVVMDLEIENVLIYVGAMVDEVAEVLEINDNQVEAPPSLGTSYQSDLIAGVAKVGDRFVMLLDLIRVFSLGELKGLNNIVDKQIEKKEISEVN